MIVKLNFSIPKTVDFIDLEELGYDSNVTWNDLTEEQQNEIRDTSVEQMWIQVFGEHYED